VTPLIPLSLPDIDDADIAEVVKVLRSGRLTLGPKVEEFERLVAQRCDRPHAVAVSSATCGLALALRALNVGPGDEVIVPAFSFVAAANVVLEVGAKPVFADCESRSMNLSAATVEPLITERTKAIMAVEVFGNPAGMPELSSLCAKYELPMVEDACEGFGTTLGADRVGRFGRLGVFSFYPNKQITTGEGGVIVTHDDRLAQLCRSMRNHGRPTSGPRGHLHQPGLGSWLEHERHGYAFRMSEINAALGVAQMRRLDDIIDRRRLVADAYYRRLAGHPDIVLPTIAADAVMSWYVYVVRLSDRFTGPDRDEVMAGLRRHEIGCADYFPPIPLMPFYRRMFGHQPGDFPVAESLSQRTIALPFHNRLTESEQDLVCQTLDLMIRRLSFARD